MLRKGLSHDGPIRFLDHDEFHQLLAGVSKGRNAVRNRCLLRLMYRHGLRASEAGMLELQHLDLKRGRIFIPRLKGGLSTWQPLHRHDLAPLRAWLSERDAKGWGELRWLFVGQRGAPLSRQAIYYVVTTAAERAGIEAHPHMLRHSTGFELTRRGAHPRVLQDLLGHRTPDMTRHYSQVLGVELEGLWDRRPIV